MEEYIEIIEDEQEETIEIPEDVINETDPTVPSWVKEITQEDIANWNQGEDLSEYATKEYVNNAIANSVSTALGGEY